MDKSITLIGIKKRVMNILMTKNIAVVNLVLIIIKYSYLFYRVI